MGNKEGWFDRKLREWREEGKRIEAEKAAQPTPDVVVKGRTKNIELWGNRVVIKHARTFTAYTELGIGSHPDIEVFTDAIQAIELKAPSWRAGTIRIIYHGDQDTSRPRTSWSTGRDEAFTVLELNEYDNAVRLRDRVAELKAQKTTVTVAQPVSVADELAKLVTLRDQGHVTDDEYQALRAKLIG